MNCKLYQKECVQTGVSRYKRSARQQSPSTSNSLPAESAQSVVSNQHMQLSASTATASPSSYFLNSREIAPEIHTYDDVADDHQAEFATLNGNIHPLSCP
jgi:hypothetical protein